MDTKKQAARKAWPAAAAILLAAAALGSGCGGQTASSRFASELAGPIQQLMAETQTPGAVVVVRSPQGNWTQTFGTRSYGGSDPIQVGDHFRVGSLTKTWTGTVILQLVQEGALALSDPVASYLPDVPNGAHISIEQLLNMTSGLFNYTADPDFVRGADANPNKVYEPDELLRIAFSHPPDFAPGTSFNYSNTNTVLLGKIIEKLTKKPVEEVFRERLFRPRGLTQTFLPPRQDTTLPPPLARGYHFGYLEDQTETGALPAAMQEAARNGSLQPRDLTQMNSSWAWTAGMGISSANELANLVEIMVGGGYLNADLQARRLASCFMPDPNQPAADEYCWAMTRHGGFYGHAGTLPGYNSYMGYDPATRTTIVVWSNLDTAPDGRLPAVALSHLIIDAIVRRQGAAQ